MSEIKPTELCWRFQALGSENRELVGFLNSYAPHQRKEMILHAVRTWWLLDAAIASGTSPESLKGLAELSVASLLYRAETLSRQFGLSLPLSLVSPQRDGNNCTPFSNKPELEVDALDEEEDVWEVVQEYSDLGL